MYVPSSLFPLNVDIKQVLHSLSSLFIDHSQPINNVYVFLVHQVDSLRQTSVFFKRDIVYENKKIQIKPSLYSHIQYIRVEIPVGSDYSTYFPPHCV